MRHNLHATVAAFLQPQALSWPVWAALPTAPPVGTPEHWVGTYGEWTNASLWSGGSVPGAQTTAIIARGGRSYIVSIDTASAVNVLRLNSAPAALYLNADVQLGTLLQVEQGFMELTAKLSGGRLDVFSTATVDTGGGTLANIQVDGALTVGTLQLDAGVHFGEREAVPARH